MLKNYSDWLDVHSLLEKGEFDAIQKRIDALSKQEKQEQRQAILMKALHNLIRGYHQKSLQVLEQNKTLFSQDKELMSFIYKLILSETNFRIDNFQTTLLLINDLNIKIKQAEIPEDDKALMQAYINRLLTYTYLRMGGERNYMELLQANLDLHAQAFYPPLYKFLDYHILTFGYYFSGNYRNALLSIEKELELCEEHKFIATRPATYHIKGLIFFAQGELETALELFTESLKISEIIGNKELIGNSLELIGETYLALENYELSITFLQRSITSLKEGQNSLYLLRAYLRLVQAFLKAQRIDDAEKQIEVIKQLNDKKSSSIIKLGYKLALAYYHSALPRYFNKAEAMKNIQEILSMDIEISEIKLEAYLLYCENLLWELKYFKEHESTILNDFMNAIESLMKFAQRTKNTLMIIHAFLLKTELFLILKDVKSAQTNILQAMNIATQKGLERKVIEMTAMYKDLLQISQEEAEQSLNYKLEQFNERTKHLINTAIFRRAQNIDATYLIDDINDIILLNPKNYVLLRITLNHENEEKISDNDLIRFLLTIMDNIHLNSKIGIRYKKMKYKNYIVYIHEVKDCMGFMILEKDSLIFNHILKIYWDHVKSNMPIESLENMEEFLLDDKDIDTIITLSKNFFQKFFNIDTDMLIYEYKNLSMLQNVKVKSLENINQDLKHYKQLLNPTRLILLKLFYDLRHVPIRLVKKRLNITWGSLHTYLKPFQEDGLITVKKGFVDDQVQTIVTITEKGIITYENLKDVLNSMFFN